MIRLFGDNEGSLAATEALLTGVDNSKEVQRTALPNNNIIAKTRYSMPSNDFQGRASYSVRCSLGSFQVNITKEHFLVHMLQPSVHSAITMRYIYSNTSAGLVSFVRKGGWQLVIVVDFVVGH